MREKIDKIKTKIDKIKTKMKKLIIVFCSAVLYIVMLILLKEINSPIVITIGILSALIISYKTAYYMGSIGNNRILKWTVTSIIGSCLSVMGIALLFGNLQLYWVMSPIIIILYALYLIFVLIYLYLRIKKNKNENI